MAKQEAAVLDEPEVKPTASGAPPKDRKIYSIFPSGKLMIQSPSEAYTDKHTLKGVPAVRGYWIEFLNSEGNCEGEHVNKVLKSAGYKTDFAFAEDLEANQSQQWVKDFVRRADLKREICNLPPLLTGKTTAKF